MKLLLLGTSRIFDIGMKEIVQLCSGIELLISEKASIRDWKRQIHLDSPDLVFIKARQSDEVLFDFVSYVRNEHNCSVCLMFTEPDIKSYRRLKNLEVKIFLDDNPSEQEILDGISAASFSSEYSTARFNELLRVEEDAQKVKAIDGTVLGGIAIMTEKEKEVLRLLLEGRSSSSIADALFNSKRTIEVHRRNIGSKLGVSGQGRLMPFILLHAKSLNAHFERTALCV